MLSSMRNALWRDKLQTRASSVALCEDGGFGVNRHPLPRALSAALTLGFILFFYSETLFWARPGRASAPELTATWLAYSVLAGALLCALATFHVRDWAALLLCGALYGWLSEGVLAVTLYDAFPVQLSWTGLAWHDIISVCAGWYGLSASLRHSTRRALGVASALGAFWGAWAVTWWQPQEGGIITPLSAFAAHAFTQGTLLMLAYALLPQLIERKSFTNRWGQLALLTVLVAWFVFITLPQRPQALWVAATLFALTIAALVHARGRDRGTPRESSPTLLEITAQPSPSWSRCAAVLALPTSAVIVYSLYWLGVLTAAINQIVFWVLTPLGFIAYAFSLWAAFKSRRQVQ